MRHVGLSLLLIAGCSSPPEARNVPLSHDEIRACVKLERQIEDARSDLVAALIHAHGLDPRTVLDPSRGVLVAPVTSAP